MAVLDAALHGVPWDITPDAGDSRFCKVLDAFLQVLFGALTLRLAEAAPDDPSTAGFVSSAQRVLSEAVACKGQLAPQDTAVMCMLLAQLVLLGSLRRKQERAQAHAMQVATACAAFSSDCKRMEPSWLGCSIMRKGGYDTVGVAVQAVII